MGEAFTYFPYYSGGSTNDEVEDSDYYDDDYERDYNPPHRDYGSGRY